MPDPKPSAVKAHAAAAKQTFRELEAQYPGRTPRDRFLRLLAMLKDPRREIRSRACRWMGDEDHPIPPDLAGSALQTLTAIALAGFGGEKRSAKGAILRLWPLLSLPEREKLIGSLVEALWVGKRESRDGAAALLRRIGRASEGESLDRFLATLLPFLERPGGRPTGRVVLALRGAAKNLPDRQVEAFRAQSLALLANPAPRSMKYGWRLYAALGRRFPEGTMFEIGRIGVELSKSPSGDARKFAAGILADWGLHHAPEPLHEEILAAMKRLKADPWASVRGAVGNADEILVRAHARPPVDWGSYFSDDD